MTNDTPLRIGILEAGKTPPDLAPRHAPYPTMFERLLQAADPRVATTTYTVIDGVFPRSVRDEDAWLVTGSPHGVYENLPWMDTLKSFLRDALGEGVPVVGICFGHQILAAAMGGEVEKSTRGWGCGIQGYDIARPLPFMDGAAKRFEMHAMHQDQVVSLPEGAEVIAGSAFCPYAALSYPQGALSFQGHPEFGLDFARELIVSRRGGVIPAETADTALAGIEGRTDAEAVARWIVAFIEMHLGGRATAIAAE